MDTPNLIIIAFLMVQTAGSMYIVVTRRKKRQTNARLRANLKTYCDRTES